MIVKISTVISIKTSHRVFDNLICTSLAQRASYLALHSSLFGPDGTVVIMLSLKALTLY